VQNDIKRVLAYSTVSQLGLMFLAMGVGAFGAGIFHLYTHAFFKALLFLGSGAVIYALHHEQDIRNMGGLRKHLPITWATFVIGSLAIAGIPGLAGFFSKDEILFETFREGHTLLWVVGALTSLLTATYMFRLVFLTFHGERRHDAPVVAHVEEEEHSHGHAAISHQHDHGSHQDDHGSHGHGAGSHAVPHATPHEPPVAMTFVLIALAIGSIFAGYIGVPHALGGHNALHAWLEPVFEAPHVAGEVVAAAAAGEVAGGLQASGESAEASHAAEEAAHAEETLELTLMGVSSGIAVLGILIAFGIWVRKRVIAQRFAETYPGLHRLLLNKYYVDELYDASVVQPIKVISRDGLWRGFDVNVIDGLVNGAGRVVETGAATLRRVQTGSVRAYAGSIFVGVIVILGYYLWR
jgi:NADH-quinone oxidoreductase subunit L